MGNIIEDLKKSKPEFRSEFNDYIQQVKLENREELSNLHSTINSLESNLKVLKFVTKDLIQKAISDKSDEISQLKSTISELRIQLRKTKI